MKIKIYYYVVKEGYARKIINNQFLILKNVSLIYFNIHRRVFVRAYACSCVFAYIQERSRHVKDDNM